MGPLVALLINEMKPFLDRPYALFGHSFGGLVAFELARALPMSDAPPPMALVVAGARPPHLIDRERRLHTLPDDELAGELRRLGGTPPEVLSHSGLMEVVLPAVRADMAVIETYEPPPGEPLSCPIVAVGGEDDPLVPPECLAAWGEYSMQNENTHVLPGGHFFLREDQDALLRVVGAELGRLCR